ncbi:MAG: hypothetical protein R3E39_05355 [Anaerolineae bacterium]
MVECITGPRCTVRPQVMHISSRERLLFILFALVGAYLITRGLVGGPGFTDVFYHLNAANRLVTGRGLTDPYLWTYIGAPDYLPAPSHLYWMPLTTLSAALGMGLLNAPGSYPAAQWPFTLMFGGTVYIGFWLGARLGKSHRHAWVAGLLTLFGGFYTRFWGAIDTFAPYAFFGSLCLVFLALVFESLLSTRRSLVYGSLGGACAALAHLTRADGILFLIVGWAAIVWLLLFRKEILQGKIGNLVAIGIAMTVAYAVIMLPWFARNLSAIGTIMPLGGTQTIWLASYDDLFKFPPDNSVDSLFAEGAGAFLASRWEAITNNIGTFIAVEGLVVMTPLMLIGLWQRRHQTFLCPFWLYALGLHLAMTFVFPFPGYRGGLLHSAAALVPWWAVLGVVGLDDVIEWVARRRRRWNANTAKKVYSTGLVGVAVLLSIMIGLPNRVVPQASSTFHTSLRDKLPPDARVMINDPAQLYYFTGLGGVVLPNEQPNVIPEIARTYGVKYLVLEGITSDGLSSIAMPTPLLTILSSPPDFLTPIPFDIPGARLYEIHY